MLDYKLLAALAAVVEQAGFERGAQVLGLSQSAVSQRIKLLEARIGQPVLLRAMPPTPTDVGRRLLNHVQQVRLLERDLQQQVPSLEADGQTQRLRIAVNADSLATWWGRAVADFCASHRVLLELVVEDQEVGLKRMRAGDVAACVFVLAAGDNRLVAGKVGSGPFSLTGQPNAMGGRETGSLSNLLPGHREVANPGASGNWSTPQ